MVSYTMEHYTPRVFENRILRRIFGHMNDTNGKERRLYNEEFHSFYRSPNKPDD